MNSKSYEMDMCNGPVLGKVLIFAIPLILSGILQLLFNAADVIVVGRYAGSDSLAAVGATTSLITLLTNVFIGLSMGVNVLVAQYYGARKENDVSETVHSAVAMSLISGAALIFIGVIFARYFLELMGTPENVIDKATIYMQIYFIGMPATMFYNFGSAILRAIGDTKRPLLYLGSAGVINVILNLVFVIGFNMDVAGVALATVISQTISALLVLRCLMKMEGCLKVRLKSIRLYRQKAVRIIKIGLPAGLEGVVFSVSNVLIQSSINSFGSLAIAGNTAGSNLDGFVYQGMLAVYQTNLSFTSQNYGARKYKRINRILITCLIVDAAIGLILGIGVFAFGPELLSIYSSDPEVIEYGMIRLAYVCVPYFLCGLMDCTVGTLRGMGYSVLPTIVTLISVCALRVVWIYTVFAASHTLATLYLSYPVSWILAFAAQMTCFLIIRRKMPKEDWK